MMPQIVRVLALLTCFILLIVFAYLNGEAHDKRMPDMALLCSIGAGLSAAIGWIFHIRAKKEGDSGSQP